MSVFKTNSLIQPSIIHSYVDKFIAQNQPFSAYEVVLTLRNQGFEASRQYVNPIIHQYMANISNYKPYYIPTNPTYILYKPVGVKSDATTDASVGNVQDTKKSSKDQVLVKNVVIGSELRFRIPKEMTDRLASRLKVNLNSVDDKIYGSITDVASGGYLNNGDVRVRISEFINSRKLPKPKEVVLTQYSDSSIYAEFK